MKANPKHQRSIRLNPKQLTELGGIAAKAILTQEWGWDLCNNLAIEASRLQKQNIAFGGEKAKLRLNALNFHGLDSLPRPGSKTSR